MEKSKPILYKELSYWIMEACFEVHNTLGPGFPENIYETATAKELNERGIRTERQKLVEINYKGEKVGVCRLDLIADGKVILELKAVAELNKLFEAQLLSYLKATGMKLGILVNFGGTKVEYKRIVC